MPTEFVPSKSFVKDSADPMVRRAANEDRAIATIDNRTTQANSLVPQTFALPFDFAQGSLPASLGSEAIVNRAANQPDEQLNYQPLSFTWTEEQGKEQPEEYLFSSEPSVQRLDTSSHIPVAQAQGSWALVGTAFVNDPSIPPGAIGLTQAATWQGGAAWNTTQVDLSQDFSKHFEVNINVENGIVRTNVQREEIH